MRTVTYESVLNGVAATAGIDPANILAHEKTLLAEYINSAVKLCWDYYPWQEFTITEKRYFREEWSASNVYAQGDEVYYDNRYYKVWASLNGNPTGAPDSDSSAWYEIGDLSDNVAWSESGLYYVGARVEYEGKDYICIAQPDGATSSGVDPVNFEYDGILPTNPFYFREIDPTFERYIGYEQTGKTVIGTVISVHKSDPRYSNAPPVNFREGREGIYIDGNELVNEVWVRYREEAPEFNAFATNDSRIPKFLVPAIKSFAYRAWLVGDGQHEKSIISEQMGYDLLVKELDRIDLQQERGQPYRITREPYRRINSMQAYVTEKTLDQIAALKSAAVNTVIKVFTSGAAKNAVVSATVIASASIGATCEGKSSVKMVGEWEYGQPACEGRFVIFPNGYLRPDASGEYFPSNTYFQITSVSRTGSVPDIYYKAEWVDSSGATQSQMQVIDTDDYLYNRGTFWDTYSRTDFSSESRITSSASGENLVKEATVGLCEILAFTGTPWHGIGIGYVGGDESNTHEVTVNPSVMNTSQELYSSAIFNSLEVGDRVGWDRQNLSGANMLVNGNPPSAVDATTLSNLIYPKNVGEVINTYGGTGVVAVEFKYNGSTYAWQAGIAGYQDFYLVTADDTVLLGCTATAEVVGQQKTTIDVSMGTYLYACKESSRSVNAVQIEISFPLHPVPGDVIGKNAVQSSYVMGSQSKYPFAKSGYYPLWSADDADDYNNDWSRGGAYTPALTAVAVGIDIFYRAGAWSDSNFRNLPVYNGNYTGTPENIPTITVPPVTATESNTLSATATLSCSIVTTASGEAPNYVEAQTSLTYSIATGSNRPNFLGNIFTPTARLGNNSLDLSSGIVSPIPTHAGNLDAQLPFISYSHFAHPTNPYDKKFQYSFVDLGNFLSGSQNVMGSDTEEYKAYAVDELESTTLSSMATPIDISSGSYFNNTLINQDGWGILVSNWVTDIRHMALESTAKYPCRICFVPTYLNDWTDASNTHTQQSLHLELAFMFDNQSGNTVLVPAGYDQQDIVGGNAGTHKVTLRLESRWWFNNSTYAYSWSRAYIDLPYANSYVSGTNTNWMSNTSFTHYTPHSGEVRNDKTDADLDPWDNARTYYDANYGSYDKYTENDKQLDLSKLVTPQMLKQFPLTFTTRSMRDPADPTNTSATVSYNPVSYDVLRKSDTVHAIKE